ncbi:unnamed protein product [Moneuplotes crassus]|uniref:Uncharacterized protein n=1 Tax=Euplotes crassus TaxID=5936 RepID=A0AAD1XVL3_EUPCR|nr:unnamed protein product [Moneuplotes crassus]
MDKNHYKTLSNKAIQYGGQKKANSRPNRRIFNNKRTFMENRKKVPQILGNRNFNLPKNKPMNLNRFKSPVPSLSNRFVTMIDGKMRSPNIKLRGRQNPSSRNNSSNITPLTMKRVFSKAKNRIPKTGYMTQLAGIRKIPKSQKKTHIRSSDSNKNVSLAKQDTLLTETDFSEFPDVAPKNMSTNRKNYKKIQTKIGSPNVRKLDMGKARRKRKESLVDKILQGISKGMRSPAARQLKPLPNSKIAAQRRGKGKTNGKVTNMQTIQRGKKSIHNLNETHITSFISSSAFRNVHKKLKKLQSQIGNHPSKRSFASHSRSRRRITLSNTKTPNYKESVAERAQRYISRKRNDENSKLERKRTGSINSVQFKKRRKFGNRIKSEDDFEPRRFRDSNEHLYTDTIENYQEEMSQGIVETSESELEKIPEGAKFITSSDQKSKKSSTKKRSRKNARYSIVPVDLLNKVNVFDKEKIHRKATSSKKKYYDMSVTPVRGTQARNRKNTATSQFLMMKNFRDSRSILKKRKLKLGQIIFKKPTNLKNSRIKNSSEYSTASQKGSKELGFKSLMSINSKRTKQKKIRSRAKQRGTIKIKNNLGIIQEEGNKKKNKRSRMPPYKSNNQRLIKKSQGEESYLTVKFSNPKGDRRRTVCSIISDDESIDKKKIFSERLPTSSHKVSSRSGQKNTAGNGSQNHRYESSYTYESSITSTDKDDILDEKEEEKMLAKMLKQSYVRRSTEFDGNGTPNLTDMPSKRRPSSALSRESFFIPYMFAKENERNTNENKDKAKAIAALEVSERLGDKSSYCDYVESKGESPQKSPASNESKQLKIPVRPKKGDQISMTDVRAVAKNNS